MKIKLTILAVIVFGVTICLKAQERNYLSTNNNLERLKEIVVSYAQWHPYPTINERSQWESIPQETREALIKDGEKYLNCVWKTIPATIALDFKRNGNRSRYEEISFGKRTALTALLFAELAENKGRFLDDITNGIWSICEETFWGVSAHIGAQKAGVGLPDVTDPVVDLFAAETSSLLSWTYYLLDDKLDSVSTLIKPRIKYEIERRIFKPYLQTDSWWMGFTRRTNNWNPWINSNVLMSALLMQDNGTERVELVHRILVTLDKFINPYPEDGGCDEGPSYWGVAGGRLFNCLEYLYKCTNGKTNIYDRPLIKNIAAYAYKMHISGVYSFNTGDGEAKVRYDPVLVYSIGKDIGDSTMMAFGSYLYNEEKTDHNYSHAGVYQKLARFFENKDISDFPPKEPLLRDFWFQESQYMGARDKEGSAKGLFLAIQGGNNAESHNHNDVGNFIIYSNGQPAIIDVGVETYTAKTFSPRRYEIWTMQSAFHNLPTINGAMEMNGPEYKAYDLQYKNDDESAQLSMDISKAYPEEAKVRNWKRTIKLNRGKNIELTDSYELNQFVKPVEMNLMTCLDPELTGDGTIELKSTSLFPDSHLKIKFDAGKYSVKFEKIKTEDRRLNGVWGDFVTRIILTTLDEDLQDTSHIVFEQ